MAVIKSDALADEVMKMMREYTADVTADMKAEAKAVAKDAIKELKQTSPEGRGSKKGHYKDGWASKVESESSVSIGIRVYNRKKPGLTHLLEKGHALRGGGRVEGQPHISIAEENAMENYERRLKERLSQ